MGDEVSFAHMTKGPVHTAIEACVNDYNKRASLLQALQALPPTENRPHDFVRILKEIAQVTEHAATYLEEEWFTWWPQKQFPELIVRHGIILAIQQANTPSQVPIVFYWMGVGREDLYRQSSNAYPFETIVARSQWQVTCLLVTPPPPKAPSPQYLARLKSYADIWTVKDITDSPSQKEEPGERIVKEYKNGLITTRVKALPPTDPMQSPAIRAQ
jgi:hypothetical protein